MNSVIEFFQTAASHVPELLQPFIIAAAGAIPFIEGEVSSIIGVWAGMNPILAAVAGAVGNFICVVVIVLLGARARKAVVARRDHKRETAQMAVDSAGMPIAEDASADALENGQADASAPNEKKPESKGRLKFKRYLTRFGVPGASLLGPLAIPTQITSTILVGAGVKTSWILLWQGIAIVCWTTLTTLIATGALVLIAG